MPVFLSLISSEVEDIVFLQPQAALEWTQNGIETPKV